MKIKPIAIREKSFFFTSQAGEWLWLPKSSFFLRPFYQRLELWDLETPLFDESSVPSPRGNRLAILSFQGEPPPKSFLATVDLEKGLIEVGVQSKEGFLRYQILAEGGGVSVRFKKKPQNFAFSYQLFSTSLKCREEGEHLSFFRVGAEQEIGREDAQESASLKARLFLGCTKTPNLQKIKERADLQEILPLWHRLGLFAAAPVKTSLGGAQVLLGRCFDLMQERRHDALFLALQEAFQVALQDSFLPTLFDESYRGYAFPKPSAQKASAALDILRTGANLIESLFVKGAGETISLMPHPLFPSGRVKSFPFRLQNGFSGEISFTWSRFKVRQVIIDPLSDGAFILAAHPEQKSFRGQFGDKKCCLFSGNHKIYCTFGKQQNFDRFEY